MRPDAKLVEVTSRYLKELVPIYFAKPKHRSLRTFFVDSSLLNCRYGALLSRGMLGWHLQTSQINQLFGIQNGKRLICRVVPLLAKPYSMRDIELIKYNLHFQLSLGIEVMIVLVNSAKALQEQFGVDNLAIVKDWKLITDSLPYDPTIPVQVSVRYWSQSPVPDVYYQLSELAKYYETYLLRYNQTTFTSYRMNLKRRYGEFLFALQSGQCAISGETLVDPWEVEHIIPIGLGGNNSLINLRLVNREPNKRKGAKLCADRFGLSIKTLASSGLAMDFHRRMSDRKLVGLDVGPDALFSLNPRMK